MNSPPSSTHLQLDPNLNVTRVLPEARTTLYRKVLADIQSTNP
jgi:hypothetical protein